MTKIAFVAAWIACGVWTYGALCAHECAFNRRLFGSWTHPEYVRNDEALAFAAAATGPAGLFAAFLVTGMFQDGWRATSCVVARW